MLCVSVKGYTRACATTTGGISDIGIFDPSDFNFTQGAAVSGALPGYSAATLRTGATSVGGAKVYLVNFQVDEADWSWKQSKKGCSTKYEHEFKFQLPDNSQNLTTFQQALDAAGCCCGLAMFVRLNSGKIFVAGERYVNGASVLRFVIAQDGSEGGSGKVYDDFNGGNITLKGAYSRNLYEWTGTWADVEALM